MQSLIGLALFIGGIGLLFKQEALVGLAWVLLGAVIFTLIWRKRTTGRLRVRRIMPSQAFLNDKIEAELLVGNRSHLPLPWLTVHDSIPGDLLAEPQPNWLLSFRGQEQLRLQYQLDCKRRGRYRIGPVEGTAGVVLESAKDPVGDRLKWPEISQLTVYPQIVSLDQLGLPSRLPLGNLKTRQPLLNDPSRIAGVRDYYPGDDPRHIDWRNTARLNNLQIKQFDRTRQMPLGIFLDLKLENLQYWRRLASEVSIVVAASLANRANQLRQPFGLYSNGFDPAFRTSQEINEVIKTEPGPALSPGQGDAWLGQILDKLAGLQPRLEGPTLAEMIGRWTRQLSWGATVAIIALEPTAELAAEMLHLRKAGYSPVAIFTASSDSLYVYRRVFDENSFSVGALRNLGLVGYQIQTPADLNVLTAEQAARL